MGRKRTYRDAPVCRLRRKHRTNKIYRLRPFLSKALQALQRLVISQDVNLPLETIAKRMSPVRKAIIVKTAKREYVHRLCQPRRRLAHARVVAPRRSPDAVARALRVVVRDRLVELHFPSQDFWRPPSKRPHAHRATS